MNHKVILWTVGILVSLPLAATIWLGGEPAWTASRQPPQPVSGRHPESSKLWAGAAYGRLPMAFEVNQGQTDGWVKFLSRGSGYLVFLTPHEAVVGLRRPKREATVKQEAPESGSSAELRMTFPGANSKPHIAGLDPLPGKSNYFIGNDPSQWRRNISTYAQVRYEDMYPGIDLIYHGNQGELEYDFVVAPGADPKTIQLAFPGAERLRLDSRGDLLLNAQGAELRFHKPVIYQRWESSAGARHLSPKRGTLSRLLPIVESQQASLNSLAPVSQSLSHSGPSVPLAR